VNREDVENSPTTNERTLGSYLKSAFTGGFALGVVGFLADWWRSLPPPEVPWYGPKLGVFYFCVLIGILGGLIIHHFRTKNQGGTGDVLESCRGGD